MRAAPAAGLRLAVAVALLGAAVAIFWPATRGEFLAYDDPDYVSASPMVLRGLTGAGVRWAFGGFHASNWHPLTLLSHMADVDLFGERPWGHHLVSVLLHAANAALLFLVLRSLTGALWRSALVAALFAVHPLHVESVAWVSERKDVLSTAFWLLALGAYLGYVRRPGPGRYLLLALAFAAGLMAKPMLVTLPLLLLLLDFWPLGRTSAGGGQPSRAGIRGLLGNVGPLIAEKLPLFALSAAAAGLALLAQRSGGALGTLEQYPLGARALNALTAGAGYIGKALWPRGLAVLYPHAGSAVSAPEAVLAALLLAGTTLAALRWARRRPSLTVGWLWYLVTLLPVLGLVQVGQQAMADRYTYVPLVGLFVAAVWAAGDLLALRPQARGIAAAAAAAALLVLAAGARAQIAYWHDGVALFSRALEVTGGNATIHNNLGTALADRGRFDEALPHYREAVRLAPGNAAYRNNLGTTLADLGRFDEALPHYREAIRLAPDDAVYHYNLASALDRLGRTAAAMQSYRRALELKPNDAAARVNLAVALAVSGHPEEAVAQLEQSLKSQPDDERVHYNLGMILQSLGRRDEAAAHFRRALEIAPGLAAAGRGLERLAASPGRPSRAVSERGEESR
jgi:Flp pilus assembly protein TadD